MSIEKSNSSVPQPLLTNWGIEVSQSEGMEKAGRVIKGFITFLNGPYSQQFKPATPCRLLGHVYGRRGFDDGAPIKTSPVVAFERITEGDPDDHPRTMFRAITSSGSQYYLYGDDFNTSMFMLLSLVEFQPKVAPNANF